MRRSRGLTLIEAVIFIVVVAVGLAGIIPAMTLAGRHNADPLVRRQALALAESLLAEVELQPFTTCDPSGPPATPGGACVVAQGSGPEAGESRTSTSAPFNHVLDYNGFSMGPSTGGILAADGTVVPGLAGYSVSVQVATGATLGTLPAADVARIQVTVTGPDGVPVSLAGYRTRQPQ